MMNRMTESLDHQKTEAALHALLRTWGLVRQVMAPYFARYGISGPQWGILRVLHRAEAGGESALRLSDVAERMLLQPPSVTGAVDRLERLALVQRSDSKSDLRVRRLRLTPAGRKLVNQVLAGHAAQVKSLFGGLNATELDCLLELLEKMQNHLRSFGTTHGHP
jgi:DNA-binding MarR family transcriptional regulator